MNTIQDLYYGRISPYEMSISAAPEYQKLKALAAKNEDLLRETLSDVSEPLVGRQGSRVSMRVARGSASLLPSHGSGIWPRDVLKKVSRDGNSRGRVEVLDCSLPALQRHSYILALFSMKEQALGICQT